MEKADLYLIENDINIIYSTLSTSTKASIEDERIMNSIIYHYTQSYLLKKTFAGSALFEDKKGHTHVGLISYHEIENESEKSQVEANSFLAANFDYIDSEAKNHPEGFAVYSSKKYNKGFFRKLSGLNDNPESKKPIFLRLSSLLKDYPNAKIPSSAFTEFGDVKFKFDDFYGNKIYTFPDIEKRSKTQAFTMDEIQNNHLGKQIMDSLLLNKRYQQIFEQNTTSQKFNLMDKRNYKIELIEFNNPYKQLNELSGFNYQEDSHEYKKIFTHLKHCGLNYIDGIKDQKAFVAYNDYGIAGLVVLGNEISEKSDKLKNNALWVSSIGASREFRGQNIGMVLLEEAANYARDNKIVLLITTYSPNGAQYLEKNIEQLIKDEKFDNLIKPDDMERDFALNLLNRLYGQEESINKNGKTYQLKKSDSPYEDFTSVVKLYREQSPDLNNTDSISDYYDKLDKKKELVAFIEERITEKLISHEIKNSFINKNNKNNRNNT